ncbi:hypothetical protein CLAFUW4_13360 [Fulvia fulva]|uniref:Uncharacterized protein n=1 Tax=Passalora fulva TaxID=5499 RepID=A0A9Q8UVL2_PASFU|nr:uncharacterized protein CLAFUR5_13215 [Fulvia fulva]KAK4612114.1 hypothetical protein CLAFUR4_13364 [Fulvia fulva]KAK4613010.1 hypothetical protein CLAFUR0_13370 [Fulvia fulva]UJO23997.1 hypothetical protein CLAFUR5_13215 [Fulvia fulva]WPV21352.1 hypothetical protein CLAFUW4_13360 [Fulvia fulva]WPV36351.1 hypothetical protein CLAFUW7_13367 [Fulvia fulva]
MATYQPCSFPRPPSKEESSIFTKVKYQLHLAYYRYEVNTGQYVMSPGEKLTYNLVVFSLLGLFFFAVSYCLPRSAIAAIHRLVYDLTGHRQALINILRAMDGVVQQSSGGVIARLKGAGVVVALNSNDTDVFAMR